MPPFLALKEYLDNAALSTMRFNGMVSRFAASPSLKVRLTPFLKVSSILKAARQSGRSGR